MARLSPDCAAGMASSAPAPTARSARPSPDSLPQVPKLPSQTGGYTSRTRLLVWPCPDPPSVSVSCAPVTDGGLASLTPDSVTQVPVSVSTATCHTLGMASSAPSPKGATRHCAPDSMGVSRTSVQKMILFWSQSTGDYKQGVGTVVLPVPALRTKKSKGRDLF